jgi:hypothetical protein
MEVGSNTEVDNAGFLCVGCAVGTLPPTSPAGPLEAITITTLGTGDAFCGGVTFKLTKPASWSAEDWAGLSASNITATLASEPYTGAFTSDDTYYYYSISGSGTAAITVEGVIGAKTVTPSTSADITLSNTLPSGTLAIVGIACFDIAYINDGGSCGVLANRQTGKAQFGTAHTYDYTLTGTIGSGTIQSVTWSFSDDNGAVLDFAPGAFSTTVTSNKSTLKYNESLLTTALGATGIQVNVTATVVVSGAACGTAIYTLSREVTIKDCQCCDGAIIYNAAWNYSNGQPGDGAKVGGAAADNRTDQSWSPYIKTIGAWSAGEDLLDDSFTAPAPSIDLCVYKSNGNGGNYSSWNNAVNKCADGTYADRDAGAGWYLPNQRELQSIYKAIGGNGSSKIDFSALATTGLGTVVTTAADMISDVYWSSTEFNDQYALRFRFNNGARTNSDKSGTSYVRCVRRL